MLYPSGVSKALLVAFPGRLGPGKSELVAQMNRTDMKQKKKDPKPNTVRPAAEASPFMNKEEFEQLKANKRIAVSE